jgi:stress response protein YsnF
MVKEQGEKHEVWKGLALRTKYGYTKKDILRKTLPNGGHRYVWKSKSEAAKKQYNSNPKVKKALQEKQKQLKKTKKLTKKRSLLKKLFDLK